MLPSILPAVSHPVLVCCLPSRIAFHPICTDSHPVLPSVPADTPNGPCPPGSRAQGPVALTKPCVVPELTISLVVPKTKTFMQAIVAGPVHELRGRDDICWD